MAEADQIAAVVKPGWRSSEFWLTAAVVGFGMWGGGVVLLTPEVELERYLAVLAAVGAAAGLYVQQRTSLKKEVAEAKK